VRQSPDPALVSPVIIAFDPSKFTLEVESEQIKCSTDSRLSVLKINSSSNPAGLSIPSDA